MQGRGKYTFSNGSVYEGQWYKGKMHGEGQMDNADGSSYTGQWQDNLMHGEGCFVDTDGVKWEGFFINGSYESKLQKKLRVEKDIGVKV